MVARGGTKRNKSNPEARASNGRPSIAREQQNRQFSDKLKKNIQNIDGNTLTNLLTEGNYFANSDWCADGNTACVVRCVRKRLRAWKVREVPC